MKHSDDDSPHEGATFTVWYKKWNMGDWSAMGRRLPLHQAEQILDDLQYKTDCRGLGYYPLKIYPDDWQAVQKYKAPKGLEWIG